MPRLVYTPGAQRDLADILAFITRESASVAVGGKFIRELRQQCRKLASLPGTLGRSRPELGSGIRSFAFRGYAIIFRYEGNLFVIINVIEGHRDISSAFHDTA